MSVSCNLTALYIAEISQSDSVPHWCYAKLQQAGCNIETETSFKHVKGEINYKRTECDSVYTFLSAVPHCWTCSDFTGMCIPDLVLVFCSLHSFFVYQQKPLHVPVEADNKAIYIQFFCLCFSLLPHAGPV